MMLTKFKLCVMCVMNRYIKYNIAFSDKTESRTKWFIAKYNNKVLVSAEQNHENVCHNCWFRRRELNLALPNTK